MTTNTITPTPAQAWLIEFCAYHKLLYEFIGENSAATWWRTIHNRGRTTKIGVVEYRLSADRQSWIPTNPQADSLMVNSSIPTTERSK